MGRDSVKALGMRLVTDKTDKFRKIDARRTTDAALRTCQATPYGLVRGLFQFI
jgi:hypothetical protein